MGEGRFWPSMIQAWPLVFGVSMTWGPRSLNLSGSRSIHSVGGSLTCPSAEIARYCMSHLFFLGTTRAAVHDESGRGRGPSLTISCRPAQGRRPDGPFLGHRPARGPKSVSRLTHSTRRHRANSPKTGEYCHPGPVCSLPRQMRAEPLQRASPSVLRRGLMVRAPGIAVEPVVGVRVADDLRCDGSRRHGQRAVPRRRRPGSTGHCLRTDPATAS